MGAYDSLAFSYDELTRDAPYGAFADFYERLFEHFGVSPKLVLDLACGTGTETCLLAERGYEMIGVDVSEDMLSVAAGKAEELKEGVTRPLFLCQPMEELDLFGTVQAALCSLDGMNYVPQDTLEEVFRRVSLFLEPGGLFVFDVHSPERLRALDGEMFIDETDDVYCVWRAEWDGGERAVCYGVDIFTRSGEKWERDFEEHIEYAHDAGMLAGLLKKSGFAEVTLFGELKLAPPEEGERRIFVAARR